MVERSGISETELIRRCKRGDLNYQEILYKRFYGYAMGIGLRYLSNRDDALETVNDAFIKVFKSFASFNENLPFKAWLRKIVVNTALDRRKKNLRQVDTTDIDDAWHVGDPYLATDELSAKEILTLLDQLPELQRAIFNLYEIDGYTHDEIAGILNINAASSRVYLGRAKEKLRKMIVKQYM